MATSKPNQVVAQARRPIIASGAPASSYPSQTAYGACVSAAEAYPCPFPDNGSAWASSGAVPVPSVPAPVSCVARESIPPEFPEPGRSRSLSGVVSVPIVTPVVPPNRSMIVSESPPLPYPAEGSAKCYANYVPVPFVYPPQPVTTPAVTPSEWPAPGSAWTRSGIIPVPRVPPPLPLTTPFVEPPRDLLSGFALSLHAVQPAPFALPLLSIMARETLPPDFPFAGSGQSSANRIVLNLRIPFVVTARETVPPDMPFAGLAYSFANRTVLPPYGFVVVAKDAVPDPIFPFAGQTWRCVNPAPIFTMPARPQRGEQEPYMPPAGSSCSATSRILPFAPWLPPVVGLEQNPLPFLPAGTGVGYAVILRYGPLPYIGGVPTLWVELSRGEVWTQDADAVAWVDLSRPNTWTQASNNMSTQNIQNLVLRQGLDGSYETRLFAIEFKNLPEIVGGATIASLGTPQVNFSGLTIGSAAVVGTQAQFTITAPSTTPVGRTFFITILATLSTGQTLEGYGKLTTVANTV